MKESHKFGIELPKAMEQSLAFDAKNGNTLWTDAISKEMEPDRKSAPIGDQFVQCHMVFNIKMADFR